MTASLFTDYILHLADNALVLAHRNSEWTGHGPILEQDIALSNIALDLIGQARNLYQYAATLTGGSSSEDSLAFTRSTNEFKNCLLAEQNNGDWGKTMLRQFLFSAYQYPLYQQLSDYPDHQLAAIAEKSLKEVTYHLRWSSEWVVRLGLGTEESHDRMTNAVDTLWKYTGELVTASNAEPQLNVNMDVIADRWRNRVEEIFSEAGLIIPGNVRMITGGKQGRHTDHLDSLLREMQYMQRHYPALEW